MSDINYMTDFANMTEELKGMQSELYNIRLQLKQQNENLEHQNHLIKELIDTLKYMR